MKESWLLRLAYRLRIKRRALAHRPAWFEAAYLASPERILFAAPRIDRSFSDREKVAVWQKGRPIVGWDPEDWRVDHRGDPIFRHHYGDSQSAFGWEIGTIAKDAGPERRGMGGATSTWTLIGAEYIGRGLGAGD